MVAFKGLVKGVGWRLGLGLGFEWEGFGVER